MQNSGRTMVRALRSLTIAMLVAGLAQSNPLVAHAAAGDTIADRVLGQTDFNSRGSGAGLNQLNGPRHVTLDGTTGQIYVADEVNSRVLGWNNALTFNNGLAASIVITSDGNPGGLNFLAPRAVAVDPSGNLFVVDAFNNRVLQFSPPITSTVNGMAATRVFGQPDFASNSGGPARDVTLNGPSGVATDKNGNLFVADSANSRVLQYSPPFNATANIPANRVFGQPNFTSNSANQGSIASSQTTLNQPFGVAVDSSGNLYVADTYNDRLLRYNAPLTTPNMAAGLVIGQQNFTSISPNQGLGLPNASTLDHPYSLALESSNNLYVADTNNSRILEYNAPLTSPNMPASQVIGQTSFNSITIGTSASQLRFPFSVAVDQARNVYVADTNNNRVLGYNTPFLAKLFLPFVSR
jgi:NHL repeat